MTRYLPSRYILTDFILPFAFGVVLFAFVAAVAYTGGRLDGRAESADSLRVQSALVSGYAAHDVVDDTTITDLRRENAALREDFEALEASFR